VGWPASFQPEAKRNRWALARARGGRVEETPHFLYTDQVGGYRAPHTPARAVWAGLVGPFHVYFCFLFLFFPFSFSFSVSFFLFLFLFCLFSFC
jgi:hypothetical protein